MACWICGVNCTRFGHIFARRLLRSAKARLSDIPDLMDNNFYKKATDVEKATIRSNILYVTRDVLREAHYSPATIDSVLEGKG